MLVAVVDVTDWRGNRIVVGATVVYPSRTGSSLWMTEGEVVSVEAAKTSRGRARIGVRALSHSRANGEKLVRSRVAYPHPCRITVI